MASVGPTSGDFLFQSLRHSIVGYPDSDRKGDLSKTIQKDVIKFINEIKLDGRSQSEKRELVATLITGIGPHSGNWRPRALRMQDALQKLQAFDRQLARKPSQEQ